MPWWAEKGGPSQGTLRKSASSPGPDWVQIPGATDAMTEQQAKQQLVKDAASGAFGSSLGNGIRKAAGAVPGVNSTLSGLASIGDFFARLSEASTWLRLAEGLLGVILIAVGVARLTHAVPIATKIAGAVA